MMLVLGALLLAHSVRNLYAVDLGFESDRVWTAALYFYPQGLEAREAKARTDRVLHALRAHPDIEAAGAATSAPFWGLTGALRLLSADGADTISAVHERVTAGYFETLGTRLDHGRFFGDQDAESAGEPLVVTRALATRLFGDPARAPGRELRTAERAPRTFTIIGVTGDMRTVRPAREPDEAAYSISRGEPVQSMLTVRMRDGVDRPATSIQEVVREVLPDMPVEPVRLQEALDARIGSSLLLARLLGLVSCLAVVLASVGLYAVVAFGVAERTREIGIRMALGARAVDVASRILSGVGRTLAVGVGTGLMGGYAAAKVLQGHLFGVQPLEMRIYAAAACFFAAVGLIAAALPLRTATRVDPLVALDRD